MNRCVIISGAPIAFIPKLKSDDFIIACDYGYKHALDHKITPDVIIGDFDSYLGELPGDIKIYRQPSQKDDTDTMTAIKFGLEKGFKDFAVYGALGGRKDHEFANYACAAYIAKHGGTCVLQDESTKIFAIRNATMHLKKEKDCCFSIFSFSDVCKNVNIKGAAYPLKNATLSNCFPLGVSNEFCDDWAEVGVEDGILIIMISKKQGS